MYWLRLLPSSRARVKMVRWSFWGQPHHEAPGEGPVRLLTPLFAELKVVVDGIAEGAAELGDAAALEGDDVPQVEHFTVEDASLFVVLDVGGIPLVLHSSSS